MDKKNITVFTPTYNRKDLLKRCYESLEKQTNKNFVWLIVDDGSIDNTSDYILNIKNKASFEIKYYYKENGGKASAHNYAVEKCKTDYLLILDSDDILVDNAIELLNSKLYKLENDDSLSGIIGNRGYFDGKIIGSRIPEHLNIAKGIELYQKFKLTGDTLRLYKTSILKDYLFPIVENERFIPENVVFDRIDEKYNMYIIHEIIYLCEYQQNGYSNNVYKIRYNNPISYSYALKSAAETAVVFKKRITWTILYIIWCMNFSINGFKNYKYKLMYLLLFPLAFLFNLMKYPKFLFKSIKIQGE